MLSDSERTEILSELTDDEVRALHYEWPFWARPDQLPPAEDPEDPATAWAIWLLMAGRGFGKTRTGAEFVRDKIESGQWRRAALVGPTAGDARDVMVEGQSGILACSPPWFRPVYEPSKRRLTWPNGARATVYSADEPARLRGPQHDGAWADEIAAWKYPAAWDMLMFGLRLGAHPQVVATTTPAPRKFIIDLRKKARVRVTRGTTYDNLQNLAPSFREEILGAYEGTTLGRQELMGELMEESPGALWTRAGIDACRVKDAPKSFIRMVTAIDPAASSSDTSDETGIVTVGKTADGHAWVLSDVSGRYKPNDWAKRAIAEFDQHRGDHVLGEVNNGGEMIKAVLESVRPKLPYRAVHATRGKAIRAEPIASFYEQGRVHHVGEFTAMEDQMCTWTPESDVSPDRMDALVWALTDLLVDHRSAGLGVPQGSGGSSKWRS